MKAIKAGKTPTPGGPMDLQPIDELLSSTNQQQPIDHTSAPSSVESKPVNEEITEITEIPEEELINPDHGLDYKTIQQAQKLAKFAISALQYDDVNNAIENLQGALRLLEKNK
jgi:vacuolar protein sorting-associated protein VTA1